MPTDSHSRKNSGSSTPTDVDFDKIFKHNAVTPAYAFKIYHRVGDFLAGFGERCGIGWKDARAAVKKYNPAYAKASAGKAGE